MNKVNVFEVKARLSEYLDRAAGGERILICRHNKPVAELRAVQESRTEPRPIGPLPGRPTFDIASSFFEPLADDELDRWEGLDDRPHTGAREGSGSTPSKVAETPPQYGSRTPRRGARRK